MDNESNGNPASDRATKSGNPNKKMGSRKDSRPPVAAYQKVARQPSNVITAGVLSARSRATRPVNDIEGQINLEMAEKFNEGVAEIEQQIFGAKVQVKVGKKNPNQTQAKEFYQPHVSDKQRSSAIDHSQLIVQNSPRDGISQSNLPDQAMNPIFRHSNGKNNEDYHDEVKLQQNQQQRSQLQSSQTGQRSNKKHMIKVMNTDEISTFQRNHKSIQPEPTSGTQTEMEPVHAIKSPAKQQNFISAKESDYGEKAMQVMKMSASPTHTQQLGEKGVSGHLSGFSERLPAQHEHIQVRINDTVAQATSGEHVLSEGGHLRQVGNATVSNPFSKFSIHITDEVQRLLVSSDVKSVPNSEFKDGGSLNQTTVAVRKGGKSRMSFEEHETTVYKVQDLIKNDGGPASADNNHLLSILQQQQQQQNSKITTKDGNKKNYIQQVMREPKMTTFEKLPRAKTNSGGYQSSMMQRTQQVDSRGFHLSSQRDTFLAMANAISSEEAIQISQNRRDGTLNSSNEMDDQMQFVVQPGPSSSHAHYPSTYHRLRDNKKAKFGLQGQQVSQGTTPSQHPTSEKTSTTTPTRASKRFAGGFGGAGSIYTHSHLTNARKLSHGQYAKTTMKPPMHITANDHLQSLMSSQHHQVGHPARVSSPCDSFNVSGDLMVAGNRTGMPEYLLDKSVQQAANDYIQGQQRGKSMMQRMGEHGFMSNDTSRSPIPIDEETYKNMNKHLPRRMDASSMGNNQFGQSRSRELSVDHSTSSVHEKTPNADIKQFTQVQPFIMSPKNLQQTLRKQQEMIRANADCRLLKTKNSLRDQRSSKPTGISPRNISTHQGKRVKQGHYKLNFTKMGDHTFQSTTGFADETSQKRITTNNTKRFQHSIEGLNNQDYVASTQQPSNATPASTQFSMAIEGKSIRNTAAAADHQMMLLASSATKKPQNDDLGAVSHTEDLKSQSTPLNVKDTHQSQYQAGEISIQQTPAAGEVAIRISKINIAITEGNKAQRGQENEFGEGAPEGNTSELTNYRDNQPINGIFEEIRYISGADFDQTICCKDNESKSMQERQECRCSACRRFHPVLKGKTYLSSQKSEAQTPQRQYGEKYNLQNLDDVFKSEEIVEIVRSPADDPDTTGILSGDEGTPLVDACTQQIAFERVSQQLNGKAAETTTSSQSALNVLQHRSRSGVGQSSSYDQDNLAPRLASKHVYQVIRDDATAENLRPNTHELNIEEFNDDEVDQDDISSEYFDKKAMTQLMQFDKQAWKHCQDAEQGPQGFITLKTQEFIDGMKSMENLDHNTRLTDRRGYLKNRLDYLLKDLAIQGPSTEHAQQKTAASSSNQVFDRFEQKLMNFKAKIPLSMIKFKNKSEQTRYIRIANIIMALNDTAQQRSQSDIEFTYMKIFRFLADILTQKEFQNLQYYHISRFIGNILHLAFRSTQKAIEDLPDMSLRMFVCYSLDLKYMKTQQSHEILQKSAFSAVQAPAKSVQNHWTDSSEQTQPDMNMVYSEQCIVPVSTFEPKESPEERHQQIQDHISRKVHTFAHEPSLPSVVRKTYFAEKETIHRGNLARLHKNDKRQDDLDYASLAKQSVIARNQIVTEHVVASRNMRQWRDDVAAEIHEERRGIMRRQTKSMTMRHLAPIIQRIY